MITRKQVKDNLAEAGVSFERCWGYLCDIKNRNFNKNKNDCFFEFQPTLANSIYSLSKLYRQISQEKKELISRKEKLSNNWFRSRMKLLSEQQQYINNAISIGKGIGDAFAWLFYQKNRHYLREHLAQNEIFHGAPGIGGIGELEFVKNIRVVHGYLVIYHGTTSILRLGDITLIDMEKFSVAGIGEIKTDKVRDDLIEIGLIFSGPGIDKDKVESSIKMTNTKPSKTKFWNSFPVKAKDRLNRQIKRVSKSYDKLTTDISTKFGLETNSGIADLESLVNNSNYNMLTYKQVSKGLLLGVIKNPSRTFYNKLKNKKDPRVSEKLDGIEDHVLKLLCPSRNDNSILVGSLYYDQDRKTPHLPGMTHPFWWPIDLDVLKKIIFQDVTVVSVFNPAHLLDHLHEVGFTITENGNFSYTVKKKDNEKILELEGMVYYMRMIQEYLFTEESIIKLIREIEREADEKKLPGPTRIEMLIHQSFGKLNLDEI